MNNILFFCWPLVATEVECFLVLSLHGSSYIFWWLLNTYLYFEFIFMWCHFQVEIVMGLEEEFGISVEEDSAQAIATVQDAADLIEKLVEKKA